MLDLLAATFEQSLGDVYKLACKHSELVGPGRCAKRGNFPANWRCRSQFVPRFVAGNRDAVACARVHDWGRDPNRQHASAQRDTRPSPIRTLSRNENTARVGAMALTLDQTGARAAALMLGRDVVSLRVAHTGGPTKQEMA